MGCEESFITVKLIWRNYLVPSLGNCAHETPNETSLKTLMEKKVSPLPWFGPPND